VLLTPPILKNRNVGFHDYYVWGMLRKQDIDSIIFPIQSPFCVLKANPGVCVPTQWRKCVFCLVLSFTDFDFKARSNDPEIYM